MAMVKFIVDTTSKLFIAKSGVTSFDVKTDLYSDAKEHWLNDGFGTDPPTAIGFDFPIRTIGGDPIGGGQFAGDLYFLRNGWQIRPDEADHQLIVSGNLFHDDDIDLFIPTLGGFTVSAIINRSNLVIQTASDDIATLAESLIVTTGNVLVGSTASELKTDLTPPVAGYYDGMIFEVIDGSDMVVRVIDSYLDDGTIFPTISMPFNPSINGIVRILSDFSERRGRIS